MAKKTHNIIDYCNHPQITRLSTGESRLSADSDFTATIPLATPHFQLIIWRENTFTTDYDGRPNTEYITYPAIFMIQDEELAKEALLQALEQHKDSVLPAPTLQRVSGVAKVKQTITVDISL